MKHSTTYMGLTDAEVATRVAAGKINDSHERTSRSISDILRANIFTRFNALLGVLLVIVLIVGSPIDAFFGLIIFINSGIGIFQEIRAKRTLDRLAILNAPTAHVMREGKLQQIQITEVVLDDTLKLQTGDQVPADGKVLHAEGLEVDESLLTGESDPMLKKPGDTVLSGSIIVAGQGYMQTTAVGKDSYAHKITAEVKKFTRARSELVEATNKLLTYISWIIVIVAPLLIWGQIAHSGNNWQEAVVRSTAAIVGMIPEGLVLLTSLAFMLATLALARRNVLVQQLPAVEGLARVDVICLDKTGTLTEGKVVLDQLVMLDGDANQKQVEAMLAAFSTEPNSPTLMALQEAFGDRQPAQATYSVPFSSARKWSAMTVSKTESWILGAPEMIWEANNAKRKQASEIAASGKRVLVFMRSKTTPHKDKLPTDRQAIALVVLSEKIRDDARETLQFFHEQGVSIKVISGDNPRTVGTIAKAVGLAVTETIDARTLPTDQAALAAVLATHNVFGRVSPDQKRQIVKALQAKGHVVAMTGDGVNDALALKDADIGIAMGSGAPATKAIAELVLLDNKFARMPRVLAEGRRVIANIERVANLFLIKNIYSLLLALAVTVVAIPYPFLPRHMSIISALTIGIPAFFLALAPNNQRYIPGFLRRVLKFAVPTGLVISTLIFISYLLARNSGDSPALTSTLAATVLVSVSMWVLVCLARPLRFWKVGLIVMMAGVFITLLAIPITQRLLDFNLQFVQLGWALVLSAVGAIIVELLWQLDQRRNRPESRSVTL